DRHARMARIEPDAALVQPAHDTVGGGQPEDAAAGEQHAMYGARLDAARRGEDVGLARARRAAAPGHTAHRAARAEHDRAAGARLGIAPVANEHAERAGTRRTQAHRMARSRRWPTTRATIGWRGNGVRWLPLNQ